LDRVTVPRALYFITICTQARRPVLASDAAVSILREEWAVASTRHGWLVGRYVIMPDHVHFFCIEQSAGALRPLSMFIAKWKEWTAKRLIQTTGVSAPVWQKQFFDHVMRGDESYAEKWTYVRDNPVRAGLVERWEAWKGQGFVDFDHPLDL
jgi:REP element-mobilizing transposase RayT